MTHTPIKRVMADIPWEDDPPIAEQTAEYERLVAEALEEEARGGNKPRFKPEEWGL